MPPERLSKRIVPGFSYDQLAILILSEAEFAQPCEFRLTNAREIMALSDDVANCPAQRDVVDDLGHIMSRIGVVGRHSSRR